MSIEIEGGRSGKRTPESVAFAANRRARQPRTKRNALVGKCRRKTARGTCRLTLEGGRCPTHGSDVTE